MSYCEKTVGHKKKPGKIQADSFKTFSQTSLLVCEFKERMSVNSLPKILLMVRVLETS